jgi:Pyruvate/2-oxoacid:ferredoxin oxidoreductase delta subunit
MGTRNRKIYTGNIEHKTQKDRQEKHWTQDTERKTLENYLSVSCAQCSLCLSFCVLYQMLPVAIFLCLLTNVARVYLSVSCAQCYQCLSFCVLCPMFHVSIFLCLVNDRHGQHWTEDTKRETQVKLYTRQRKIDTGNIGHET